MRNEDYIQHSSKGTHWTKKNHKYIKKIGNRYIYPSDLKKMGSRRTNALNSQGSYKDYEFENGNGQLSQQMAKKMSAENSRNMRNAREQATEVRELARMEQAENRQKAVNRQASPNYKQLSQQHANREAAKNGKIVNPTYTLRDEKGNRVARLKSNDKVMATPGQEYAKWQASQKRKQTAMNKQGSGVSAQQNAKVKSMDQRRKNALNSQGSGKGSQQYAKEQDNWNQIDPGTTRAKRKLAMYRQGNSRFADDSKYTKKHVTKEMAQRTDDFDKDFGRRKYSESATEKNKEVISSKAAKKLKDKGYFTVKNGETVFVPSDEITMKKVSKGKQIVDKIKSFFSKAKKKISEDAREVRAKNVEKKYFEPAYTKTMGYNKSRQERLGVDERGVYANPTGNEGAGNLRKGVEAGRKRAGIKSSGNVQGLENNLRNKGYNASTDASWENANDNWHGSYAKANSRRLDGTSYNDLHASRSKHDNEKIRQNLDRYRTNDGELFKNELQRGTEAGRKRVASKNARKTAKATNSRIQSGVNAGRTRALKTGDLPTPYTDKRNAAVDVDKYKNMSFTSSEMNKIKSIAKKANSYSPQQDQSRINYLDSLPKKDRELYFSYIRKQIANSK
ncbi:MAG: hypothetical protein J6Y02_00855 [Pseudobutyrivibrio sp.]|nr:hypothetical protein [Pseudobutyrivibrio sp.]